MTDLEDFRVELTSLLDTLEWTDEDVARILKVSAATIWRWREGISSPHPLGRPSIMIILKRAIHDKGRVLGLSEERDGRS